MSTDGGVMGFEAPKRRKTPHQPKPSSVTDSGPLLGTNTETGLTMVEPDLHKASLATKLGDHTLQVLPNCPEEPSVVAAPTACGETMPHEVQPKCKPAQTGPDSTISLSHMGPQPVHDDIQPADQVHNHYQPIDTEITDDFQPFDQNITVWLMHDQATCPLPICR